MVSKEITFPEPGIGKFQTQTQTVIAQISLIHALKAQGKCQLLVINETAGYLSIPDLNATLLPIRKE